MIHEKFFGAQAARVTHQNLGEAIQQAIEIEIATIPTCLFTYYSINRAPDQQAMINKTCCIYTWLVYRKRDSDCPHIF
jgi:hypothetical protein